MNQLKLLWELEKNNSIIDKCRNSLMELEHSIQISDLTTRINDMELRINQIEEIKRDNNKQVAKLERLLKEYDYSKEKLESNLYNGSITDLKQLEHLTREKNGILEKIDEAEFNILEKMDENDSLQKEYNSLNDQLNNRKKEILDLKRTIDEEINMIQIEMKHANQERNNILPNIEEEILERYEKIRNNRAKGIVHVNNYICSGCNVRIPTYLVKNLRDNDEIIFCESCGRILYYIRQDISSS